MAEAPRTEAGRALEAEWLRNLRGGSAPVDFPRKAILAIEAEASGNAAYPAFMAGYDKRDERAAIEAQDTAASSGLREALDQHRLSSRGAGLWSCRCGYSGLGYIDHLVAALAHSTPEPSLRDALAAALCRIHHHAIGICGDRSWDKRYRCVKPKGHPITGPGLTDHEYRTEGRKHPIDEPCKDNIDQADAIIAALPGLSLSAQPSEPGETA